MAQQGVCPKSWRCSSLAYEPSNEWNREKEKSKRRTKSNKRKQTSTQSPRLIEMRLNPSLRRTVKEKSLPKLKTLGFRLKP